MYMIVHCVGDLALQQCMLGMEFSGRDPTGKRVMGLLPAKGLATSVDADKRFLWDVPSDWSVLHFYICSLFAILYYTVLYSTVIY